LIHHAGHRFLGHARQACHIRARGAAARRWGLVRHRAVADDWALMTA
jgi:hypothetical protein